MISPPPRLPLPHPLGDKVALVLIISFTAIMMVLAAAAVIYGLVVFG